MVIGRRRTQAGAAVLLILSLLAPSHALAQAGSGTLTGRVVDVQGAAIPGALVTATEAATGAVRTATIVHGMRRRGHKYGMVTMCIGTGMGAAGILEAL